MKLMANTIVKYILNESKRNIGSTVRFVLPSYPPCLLYEIGDGVLEGVSRTEGYKIGLEYGVASQLGEKWEKGSDIEREMFNKLKTRNWYNYTDNLTSLRNRIKYDSEDGLIVLLAGYEDINDQASLEGFFHLDQKTLWEICLKKSFEAWVSEALRKYVNPEGNEDSIEKISNLFRDLFQVGFADPLAISEYLDSKDFSNSLDGRDAFRAVLSDLNIFGLPNLIGFEKTNKKSFTHYLVEAQKFMNYYSFIDEASKRKAKERIESFRDNYQGELGPEVLGVFKNSKNLLESLEEYINSSSLIERANLATADFVFINDNILQFKLKREKTNKPSVTKLNGHVLEVILHALWLTLAEYKKERSSVIILDQISKISLHSVEFKHQYEKEDTEKAKHFLRALIGGVDKYLHDHIQIEKGQCSIKIESVLYPDDQEESIIIFSPARNTIPSLKFDVTVYAEDNKKLSKQFIWLLPKNCQSRLLVTLFEWAIKEYRSRKDIILPVFCIQYVNEMFMAKDEEDLNRIMDIALEKQISSVEDLFAAPNLNKKELQDSTFKLSSTYQEFLMEFSQAGFISALNNKCDSVRKAYVETLEHYIKNYSVSSLGPLLMKAFMFVPVNMIEIQGWQWKSSLHSGVITPLHPALLDMIHNQHSYLCKSFCSYVKKGLTEGGSRGLAEKNWRRLVDLAQVKWPLIGLLEENDKLNSNVRGYGYIHLIGSPNKEYSSVSSRLLVEYEDSDDEDISDSELFHETQASNLIKQVLMDYCRLFLYANDGLSVGVYCGGPIQQVISGCDSFLAEVAGRARNVYSLNLTIFSDSPEDTGVITWVEAWKKKWQEAEGSSTNKHYCNSKITVYYRVVPDGDRERLTDLLNHVDLDVMFFLDFTRPQSSYFKPLSNSCQCGFEDYLKFPVLEKVNCAIIDGGKIKERELVLSNRRFRIGTLHAEVMARLSVPYSLDPNIEHVVVSNTDYSPWECVINTAHKNCGWVVCIDPIIDEKLIERNSDRRVIGFGTGVGPHGENNFTVSTEQYRLTDVVEKISGQLATIIISNKKEIITKVADSLINEAFTISGLSIVKATGPSQYVRDYIAYSLVRKLLPKEDGVFCDEIVSLDAFLHWFDYGAATVRPDLLRLQAKIENGFFKIRAQIIECKLAHESEGYLEKALQQVEEGLTQLVLKFRPRISSVPVGVEDNQKEEYPPDQRYWWMQLHRLISSRGEIHKSQHTETLQALESLSDGCFDIEWEAAVIAFWTDVSHGEVTLAPQWSFSIDDQDMNIYSVQCGKEFIINAGLGKSEVELFDHTSTIQYYHTLSQSSYSTSGVQIRVDESQSTPDFDVESDIGAPQIEPPTVAPIQQEISIPPRILLGRGAEGGRDVFWEFGHPDLPNRHLLIFGASGTGKTYTVQAVMAELSKCGMNSLIVDYTRGFSTQQLEQVIVEKLNPTQHIVRKQPLAINPFRKQCEFIDDEPLEDTSAQVAQRASGVFAEVYRLGEQQKAILYSAIQEGVEEAGNTFNLNMLVDKLEDLKAQGGLTANPSTTVLNKIRPFVDLNPFGKEDPESWEALFLDPVSRCHVIQLAGFMKDSARLITEFSLLDLYWYYRTTGSKDQPRVIILDEIQNLDHSLDSPLGQFLTEGRKFGISLILATQTLSNFSKDEKDRLFQASHKLFFKPADTEIKTYAQLLSDTTNDHLDKWVQRLSSLKRGECYSLGHAYNPATDKLEVNRAFKIKITSLEDRC